MGARREMVGAAACVLLVGCGPSGLKPGASVEISAPGVSLGASPFVSADAGGVWVGWEERELGTRLARYTLNGTQVVAPTTVIGTRDLALGVRFAVRGGQVLASDYGASGTRWTVVGLGSAHGLVATSPIHETPEAVWWSAGTPDGFALYGLDGVLRTDSQGVQTSFVSAGERGSNVEALAMADGAEWTVERDGAVRDLRRDGVSVALLGDVLGAELAVGLSGVWTAHWPVDAPFSGLHVDGEDWALPMPDPPVLGLGVVSAGVTEQGLLLATRHVAQPDEEAVVALRVVEASGSPGEQLDLDRSWNGPPAVSYLGEGVLAVAWAQADGESIALQVLTLEL